MLIYDRFLCICVYIFKKYINVTEDHKTKVLVLIIDIKFKIDTFLHKYSNFNA